MNGSDGARIPPHRLASEAIQEIKSETFRIAGHDPNEFLKQSDRGCRKAGDQRRSDCDEDQVRISQHREPQTKREKQTNGYSNSLRHRFGWLRVIVDWEQPPSNETDG